MRNRILAGAAALALAAPILANAQTMPPPGPPADRGPPPGASDDRGPPPGPRRGPPPGPMAERGQPHWHGMQGWHGMGPHHGPRDRMIDPSTFSLFHRPADRNLSPQDVQKIAEAFLLWQGNHSWKIVDVAPVGTDEVGFAIATAEGSPIAKFTMNRHTGKLTRTG
ncbi:MAG: hypothetical protein AB7F35_09270 [Acetobacteraceae bacterium]